MSVDIDLELNAGDVEGQIARIAGELEALEDQVNDLDNTDIDFDGSNISSQIQSAIRELEDLDLDSDAIARRIEEAVEKADPDLDLYTSDIGGEGSAPGGENDPPRRLTVTTELPDYDEDNFNVETPLPDGGDSDDGGTADADEDRSFLGRDYPSFANFRGPDQPDDIFEYRKRRTFQNTLRQLRQAGKGMATDFDLDRSPMLDTAGMVDAPNVDVDDMRTEAFGRKFGGMGLLGERAFPDDLKELETRRGLMNRITRMRQDGGGIARDFDLSSGDLPDIDDRRSAMRKFGSLADEVSESMGKLDSKLRRLKPTMGKYMQLFAALIPMMASLVVNALGVAAALGAVAGAGAAMLGFGLLGHAESYNAALMEMEQRVKQFKKELWRAFQPTMSVFAPIQARFLDWVPGKLSELNDELIKLRSYEGLWYTLFSEGVDLAERLVTAVNRNEQAIKGLTRGFANIVSSNLVGFLTWLIQTADRNQDLMMGLGRTLVYLGLMFYNVATTVSRVIANLQPLFKVLAWISGLLNSELVGAILSVVVAWGAFLYVSLKLWSALYGVMMIMSTIGSAGVIGTLVGGIARITGMLYGLIAAAWQANAALTVLGGIVTGGLALGAAAVTYSAVTDMMPDAPAGGSGMGSSFGGGGSSVPGGGGTVVYEDNRTFNLETGDGTVRSPEENRIRDTVEEMSETDDEMSPPGA